MSEAGSDEGGPFGFLRKIRLHKPAPAVSDVKLSKEDEAKRNALIDRKIAELIPGIAEVSVSEGALAKSMKTAAAIREEQLSKERARLVQREATRMAELEELEHVYDMGVQLPCDDERPGGIWKQTLRPEPKKVVISHYQAEMINYQRMHLRKNIWYYRDRMNVAR